MLELTTGSGSKMSSGSNFSILGWESVEEVMGGGAGWGWEWLPAEVGGAWWECLELEGGGGRGGGLSMSKIDLGGFIDVTGAGMGGGGGLGGSLGGSGGKALLGCGGGGLCIPMGG